MSDDPFLEFKIVICCTLKFHGMHIYTQHMLMFVCILRTCVPIQIIRPCVQKLYPKKWRRVKEAMQNLLLPKNLMSLVHCEKLVFNFYES